MLKMKHEIVLRLLDDLVLNLAIIALGAYLVEAAVARMQVRDAVVEEAAQTAVQGLSEICRDLSELEDAGSEVIVFCDEAFRKVMSSGPKPREQIESEMKAVFFPGINDLYDRFAEKSEQLKRTCDRNHFWLSDEMYDEFLSYPSRFHEMDVAAARGDFAKFSQLRSEMDSRWPTVDRYLESLP